MKLLLVKVRKVARDNQIHSQPLLSEIQPETRPSFRSNTIVYRERAMAVEGLPQSSTGWFVDRGSAVLCSLKPELSTAPMSLIWTDSRLLERGLSIVPSHELDDDGLLRVLFRNVTSQDVFLAKGMVMAHAKIGH